MSSEEPNGSGRLDPETLDEHCRTVVEWMTKNRVTPFLGAGVNMADRPAGAQYEPGKYLPSGAELAKHMATRFDYPWEDKDNLLRVSWYTANKKDPQTLYYYLQEVFDPEYATTSVHKLLASLPKKLADKGFPNRYQVIVTTNYDDVLERALIEAGEEFDILYFQAKGPDAGFFYHVPHGRDGVIIRNPHEYSDLPIETGKGSTRTIIVKIHGALVRTGPEDSSYVVTEDDYIDYLARVNMTRPLPKLLEAELQKNRFLFLGYSLKDWNLRVFLRRISQGRPLPAKSWAIMHEAEDMEKFFWEKNGVDFLKLPLKDYVTELEKYL